MRAPGCLPLCRCSVTVAQSGEFGTQAPAPAHLLTTSFVGRGLFGYSRQAAADQWMQAKTGSLWHTRSLQPCSG
jgi:hypothetical protein